MVWTPPKTWNVGDVLASAELNLYIRDNQNAIGKLTSYTPTWGVFSGVQPTLGNGGIEGKYLVLEEWVWLQIIMYAGNTTTAGTGVYYITGPTGLYSSVLRSVSDQTLFGSLNDLGTARYMILGAVAAGGTLLSISSGAGAWLGGGQQSWTNAVPFAFGNGDTVSLSGFYRRY